MHHQDFPDKWFERRLKRMAMLYPFLENLFHQVAFIVWIPKVTLKWLWNFSVTNNFNFLYMSWVFYPAFSFSTFNWKFKTVSVRNYNQHLTFKESWEEFCRNFISYIWKSFEVVVISNIVMKLIAVLPWSGFPMKMIAIIF